MPPRSARRPRLISRSNIDCTLSAGDVRHSVVLVNMWADQGACTLHGPLVEPMGLIVLRKMDSSSHPVCFVPQNGETVNQGATVEITEEYASLLLIRSGADWAAIPVSASAAASMQALAEADEALAESVAATWAHADVVAAAAQSAANAHSDAQDTATLTSANAHSDAAAATALSSANTHADTGDAATLASAKTYADTGDASTLAAAKAYADTRDGVTLTSAQTYADTHDASTLSSAQSFATTAAGNAQTAAQTFATNAANAALTSANSAAAAGDTTTLNSAKAYADTLAAGLRPQDALLFSQTTVQAGDAFANSTAENTFATTYTLPAGGLRVGDVLEIDAWGLYSSILIAAGTTTFKLKFGSTVVTTTGTFSLLLGSTDRLWRLHAVLTVTAVGASGKLEAQGSVRQGAATGIVETEMSNTGTITINTTQAQTVAISVQLSVANLGNKASMREMAVRIAAPNSSAFFTGRP